MHHHRRRKKRPNYGTRSVDVTRGINGFGFTISGQQPCILSCIVSNSPADLAGLRAGDFLISVNGLNVSKLPHEAVVQLIGNSIGTIQMSIAENYYSDSSEDENLVHKNRNRVRPKYPHHKMKINRTQQIRSSLTKNIDKPNEPINNLQTSVIEDTPSMTSHSIIHSPNASNKKDIYNISAMVRKSSKDNEREPSASTSNIAQAHILEYRTIVGYLGTIEMPKQIATSSKLQTVRSCIRKLRQEKRNPTIVLMTILPTCLTLRSNNHVLLAKYPTSRLSYVSSSSENDNRFFGLVTSAIYADGLMCESADIIPHRNDIVISNSCHVFVIDTKLADHSAHVEKADAFKIGCTKDPISNLCLEFPNNSEYVVNLIRSMYTLKSVGRSEISARQPNIRSVNIDFPPRRLNPRALDDANDMFQANSPQPSNHSEITTTSSNSDSGIGFHNDCTNISDRILVVDFPVLQHRQIANIRANFRPPHMVVSRPTAIINEVPPSAASVRNIRSKVDVPTSKDIDQKKSYLFSPLHTKAKSMDLVIEASTSVTGSKLSDSRLAVRALTDQISSSSKDTANKQKQESIISQISEVQLCKIVDDVGNIIRERPIDVPSNFELLELLTDFRKYKSDNFIRNHQLAARSCDDMMMSCERESHRNEDVRKPKIQMSIDDISLLGDAPKPQKTSLNEHIFLPPKPIKKLKKLKPTSDDFSIGSKSPRKMSCDNDKLMSYKLSPKVYNVLRPVSLSVEDLSAANLTKTKQINNDGSIWGSLQELRSAEILTKPFHTYLEGTYSEPDLTSRAQANNNSSPFKRWGQSSFRSRSNETSSMGRPSSLAASEDNEAFLKSLEDDISSSKSYNGNSPQKKSRVTSWGTSFERLLKDSAGLHTFAEFLKKEFSAENIYFWATCERYRQLDDADRTKEAIVIFSKHLGVGAPEPVNVDSQARNTAQDKLQRADRDLFMQAQKQIFNLMKFDSYQRFIRSDLYKSCLDAESKNQPLPYPGDQLDAGLRTGLNSPISTKLKKSLSNAEDRRRKSLLPWHRKARCKSKDRDDYNRLKKAPTGVGTVLKAITTNSGGSDIHSSKSSLSSFDAAISSRTGNQNDSDESKSSLCRVIINDDATTIVQTRPNENIRVLVERLLEKRAICYQAYEVFLAGTGNVKPLDLDGPSTSLAGKEVCLEQRVVFKLDLPNRKVISVKSKPCKALGEVLRPILHKYNYRLDLVQVLARDSTESLNMSLPVTVTDGQRLQIVCKPAEWQGEVQQIITTTQSSPKVHKTTAHSQTSVQQLPNYGNQLTTNMLPIASSFLNGSVKNVAAVNKMFKSNQQNKLDEITNKVFNELLQGKVESHAQGVVGPQRPSDHGGSTRSEDWGSETSSGIFGRLRRRDSNFPVNRMNNNRIKKLGLPSKSSTAGSEDGHDGIKKPIIAKLKAGVKLQVTGRSDNHDFLEGLKRAQCSRLEDQRGTEINFELPDFLKDKENFTNNKLRKTRIIEPVPHTRSNFDHLPPITRPQPAPRLSITKCASTTSIPNRVNDLITNFPPTNAKRLTPTQEHCEPTIVFSHQNSHNSELNTSYSSSDVNGNNTSLNTSTANSIFEEEYDVDNENETDNDFYNPAGPPPLPPKPKILPMKPSNWGQSPGKNPIEAPRTIVSDAGSKQRNAYLDQPSSSFV